MQEDWISDINDHINMRQLTVSDELMDLFHRIFLKDHEERVTLDDMLDSDWMKMSAFGGASGGGEAKAEGGQEQDNDADAAILDELQAVADLLTERKPRLVKAAVEKVLSSVRFDQGEIAPDFVVLCKAKFDLMMKQKLHKDPSKVAFTELMHTEKQG